MKIKTTVGPITMPGGVSVDSVTYEGEFNTEAEFAAYTKSQKEMFEQFTSFMDTTLVNLIHELDRVLGEGIHEDEAMPATQMPVLGRNPNWPIAESLTERREEPQVENELSTKLPRGFTLSRSNTED